MFHTACKLQGEAGDLAQVWMDIHHIKYITFIISYMKHYLVLNHYLIFFLFRILNAKGSSRTPRMPRHPTDPYPRLKYKINICTFYII